MNDYILEIDPTVSDSPFKQKFKSLLDAKKYAEKEYKQFCKKWKKWGEQTSTPSQLSKIYNGEIYEGSHIFITAPNGDTHHLDLIDYYDEKPTCEWIQGQQQTQIHDYWRGDGYY